MAYPLDEPRVFNDDRLGHDCAAIGNTDAAHVLAQVVFAPCTSPAGAIDHQWFNHHTFANFDMVDIVGDFVDDTGKLVANTTGRTSPENGWGWVSVAASGSGPGEGEGRTTEANESRSDFHCASHKIGFCNVFDTNIFCSVVSDYFQCNNFSGVTKKCPRV